MTIQVSVGQQMQPFCVLQIFVVDIIWLQWRHRARSLTGRFSSFKASNPFSSNALLIVKSMHWLRIQLLTAGLEARFVLALLRAGKPRLLFANAVVELRRTSKLDAILDWRLAFSDCWMGPRFFGAVLRSEQMGPDIARTTEIWPHDRIVITSSIMSYRQRYSL